MVRTALRTIFLLAALTPAAHDQADPRYEPLVQRFGELLKRDEIVAFGELSAGSVWLPPWRSMRMTMLAYEAIDISSVTITEVRGSEIDVRICGTGVADGRRNAPRRALPERWTLTIDDRGRIAAVTTAEERLAIRVIAANSEEERCRMLASEPVAIPLLIPLLLPRDRAAAQAPGGDAQAALALSLAQKDGSPSAEVFAWAALAYISGIKGRLEEGLRRGERAKAVSQLSDRPFDWDRGAMVRGHALRMMERYDEAAREYEYALGLYGQSDINNTALEADLSLGMAVRLRGEYAAALEHYERVLRVAPELDLQESVALAQMNIGGLYMEMNYEQAARTYLRQAVDTFRRIGSHNIRVALVNLSHLEKRFGNHDLAAELIREVLSTDQGRESISGVIAAQSLADLHVHRGELAEARKVFDAAIPIARRIAGKRAHAVFQRGEAGLLLREGRYTEARDVAAEATKSLDEVNDLHTSIESRTFYAQALYCLGDVERAIEEMRRATEDIERLRAPISFDPEGRARFFEDKRESYQYLTEMLAEQGRMFEALQASEAMKARVLRSVHGGDPADAASLAPEERQRRKSIEDELRDLNRKLASARGAERRQLEERLFRKRGELQEFFARLAALHDRQAFVPAAEVVVPPGAVFVNFVVGPDSTAVLVAENRGGRVRITGRFVAISEEELEARVTKFTDALTRRDLAVDREGEKLYRLLISPIESLLPRGATLCILPDGPLWRIPFHALRTPRGEKYLLDEHPVFYAPSLRMLALAGERRAAANAKRFLVAFGMPGLPEATEEVHNLGALYGAAHTRAFTGAAATESVFKREAGRAHVLHIATHGIVDDSAPMYSALLFAAERGGSSEDGRLEAREVIELDLDADVAVLSACDTARGHIGAGEGVIGLSWAFLIAGCPTTVVSHWKAESRTTRELMTTFHAALLDGRSKVDALRLAQLAQRKSGFGHPFYWAPFVVLGSP